MHVFLTFRIKNNLSLTKIQDFLYVYSKFERRNAHVYP